MDKAPPDLAPRTLVPSIAYRDSWPEALNLPSLALA